MNRNEYNFDPKFANWNKFYDDLFEEIAKIREIGNKVLFDVKNKNLLLNQYYSLIAGLFSTHSHYIIESDKIRTRLQKIEEFIFSDEYLTAIEENSTKIKKVQRQLINDLRFIFMHMCDSFAENGVSVKVEMKKKRDPNKAILEGYH